MAEPLEMEFGGWIPGESYFVRAFYARGEVPGESPGDPGLITEAVWGVFLIPGRRFRSFRIVAGPEDVEVVVSPEGIAMAGPMRWDPTVEGTQGELVSWRGGFGSNLTGDRSQGAARVTMPPEDRAVLLCRLGLCLWATGGREEELGAIWSQTLLTEYGLLPEGDHGGV